MLKNTGMSPRASWHFYTYLAQTFCITSKLNYISNAAMDTHEDCSGWAKHVRDHEKRIKKYAPFLSCLSFLFVAITCLNPNLYSAGKSMVRLDPWIQPNRQPK